MSLRLGLPQFLATLLALAACGSSPTSAPADASAETRSDASAGEATPPLPDAAAPETSSNAGSDAASPGAGNDAGPDTSTPEARPDVAFDVAAPETGSDAAAPWPSVAGYGVVGPLLVLRETNTGPGGAYDVFRPATLGPRRHPTVSWANGTLFGLDDYQDLLRHWASHGFVVIAGHTNTTAGGGTHKAALDWMRAEAARAGGPYFDKLDGTRVAAAGHSQGGGATIAAGAGKAGALALTTTLPLMPILSYESDKSILAKQTALMLNINATMDDRDPQGAIPNQIFDAATGPLVQAAFIGIHEDAMSPAMLAPTLAWLRARLMDDAKAWAMFHPPGTCGLCTNAAWKQVREKNVP